MPALSLLSLARPLRRYPLRRSALLVLLACLPLLLFSAACGDDDEESAELGAAGDACMNDQECAPGLFCDRGMEQALVPKDNGPTTPGCEAACVDIFPDDEAEREACIAACDIDSGAAPGGSFPGGGEPGQSALPGDSGGAQGSGVIPSDPGNIPGVPDGSDTRGATPMGTCSPS